MLQLDSRLRRYLQLLYLDLASYFNPVWWIIDKKSKSILDLGCGDGKNILLLKKRIKEIMAVGVDIHDESLEKAKDKNCYIKLIRSDITKIKFKEKSFDCIICLQVVEHLNKKDALKIIEDLQRYARKQIIISTPIGELIQGRVGTNIHQTHKSFFTAKYFQNMGFTVKSIGNRWLSSQEGIQSTDIHWLIKSMLLFVDVLFTPVYFIIPSLANHYFIAYKKYH